MNNTTVYHNNQSINHLLAYKRFNRVKCVMQTTYANDFLRLGHRVTRMTLHCRDHWTIKFLHREQVMTRLRALSAATTTHAAIVAVAVPPPAAAAAAGATCYNFKKAIKIEIMTLARKSFCSPPSKKIGEGPSK